MSKLRKARKARGWSRERLAAESGVSRASIQRIEVTGASAVLVKTLDRLAETLDLRTGDLLDDDRAVDVVTTREA